MLGKFFLTSIERTKADRLLELFRHFIAPGVIVKTVTNPTIDAANICVKVFWSEIFVTNFSINTVLAVRVGSTEILNSSHISGVPRLWRLCKLDEIPM